MVERRTYTRRKVLAGISAGGLFSLAGCGSDDGSADDGGDGDGDSDGDGDGDNGGNTPSPTATPTQAEPSTPTESPSPTGTPTESPTPTATPTPEAFSELAIESAELITIETSFDERVGGEVTVTNTGDAMAQNFQIGVDWLDADGEYIATTDVYGRVLDAGETWVARAEAWLDVEEPERIEGVEATITDESPFGDFDVEPEGIELTESTMRASDEEVVVRGVVENNRDTSEFVEVGAKVYSGDGVVIGMASGIEEVAGGDSWRFEVTPNTHGRNGQADSATVVPYI